jgi:hypothetical protein
MEKSIYLPTTSIPSPATVVCGKAPRGLLCARAPAGTSTIGRMYVHSTGINIAPGKGGWFILPFRGNTYHVYGANLEGPPLFLYSGLFYGIT